MPGRHARRDPNARRVRRRPPVRKKRNARYVRSGLNVRRVRHRLRPRTVRYVPREKAVLPEKTVRYVRHRRPEILQGNAARPVSIARRVLLLRETVRPVRTARIRTEDRIVRKEENVRDSALLAKDVLPVTEEERVRKEAAEISVRADRDRGQTGAEIPAEMTESLLQHLS